MKKLLHERLREADISDGLCIIPRLSDIECKNQKNCLSCYQNTAIKFADEIERDYTPKLRYEDGEPLKCGDKIDYKGETLTVYNYEIHHGLKFYYTLNLSNGKSVKFYSGEIVRRPKPKVLDADGIEINVGDTVWNLDMGSCGIVDTIEDEYFNPGKVIVYCVNEYGYRLFAKHPERLTHNEPILDADGVEIKVGNKVYDLLGMYDCPLAVISINDKAVTVSIPDGKGYTNFTPDNLTHNEPDSLEKIIESMVAYSGEYVRPDTLEDQKIYEWVTRLNAILERDTQ